MNKLGHYSRLAWVLCAAISLASFTGCGGVTNSSGNSGATNSGGPPSSSSNPGRTGGNSGASGATFVYSDTYANGGGVLAFNQDSSGGLTQVSGSPYLQKASVGMPALAATNGYVYTANIASNANHAELIQLQADSSTGALTQVGTSNATISGQQDDEMQQLLANPSTKVMYGVFQRTINSYGIGSNGTPSLINSTAPSTDSVWGFDFMPKGPYAYAAIQNGNPKTGFQPPEIHLLDVNADGSVTDNRSVATLSTAGGIAGALKIDPSGKYVLVSNGQTNSEISVFAIGSDGSLAEVPGSPFSTGEQSLKYMAFDSSGKFLYVVNSPEAQPEQGNIQVFAFNPTTGALTEVQTLDLPSEEKAAWLKIDGNYMYLTEIANAGLNSTITVYNRDSSSGQLTQASTTTVQNPLGETGVLHF